MTRTVRFHETGGPDVLIIENSERPSPQADEVLIKVEAIGLNRAELAFRQGAYLERATLPARLGYEASGQVIAVGSAVQNIRPGDNVGVLPNLSMNAYGTYGDEILAPATSLILRPANVDSVTFAALWMAYITAYGGLVDIAALQPRDFVLITAASSSVGLAAIQTALAIGATPIAVTRSDTKREALLGLGAPHVIVIEDNNLVPEVKHITGGAGARVVFDAVAGPYVETLAKATSGGGQLLIYGGLSGQPTAFPGGLAMSRGLSFRGYTLFEITRDPVRLQQVTARVLADLEAERITPIIDKVFTLSDVAEAHRYMELGNQVGKVILVPD